MMTCVALLVNPSLLESPWKWRLNKVALSHENYKTSCTISSIIQVLHTSVMLQRIPVASEVVATKNNKPAKSYQG